MPFPTLTQMYEEFGYKKFLAVIGIAGHLVDPNPRDIHYDFSMGAVPTLSFTVDNPAPIYMLQDAAIQLWVGFNGQTTMAFNGTIESVSPSESGLTVQASGQSKKLDAPYKALLVTTDGVKSVSTLISDIFALGNVYSFVIDLPAWTPGTVVHQPLKFSSLGEGINKLAEPFGSPYYEMPSGVIRVDVRDPIPAPTPFRTYFSGVLTDGSYALPASVAATNPNALPTLRRSASETLSRDVRNKVIVRGASVPGTGGAGEVISTLLEEIAFGSSPWIPPVAGVDQFVEMVFQNEFIDTVPDMVAVSLRLFNVWNRLYEKVTITVDGDPEIFLGATVEVIDLGYSRINALYVVMGYSCDISDSGFTTTLHLQGGRSAGVTPALSPFAFFTWTNANVPIHPTKDPNLGNPNNKAPNAAKQRQFVPKADPPVSPDPGQDPAKPGDDGQRVIVTFDASASVDPDGRIVSYAWLDTSTPTPHSGTGQRFTVTFNPDDDSSVDMTLTVTDNSGLTASVTQTVNVNTFGPTDGYGGTDDTGTTEDPSAGGGVLNVPVIFVALLTEGIAATTPGDGGSTFNTYPDFGHTMRCVVAEKFKDTSDMIAIYAGSVVYITTSYLEVVPTTLPFGDYGIANDIVGSGGSFTMVTSDGSQSWVLKSEDYGATWTEQAQLSDEVFFRVSGQYILGSKGVWILGKDGDLTPLDPDQEGVSPYIAEPAYLLLDETGTNKTILFNGRYIANVDAAVFDGSGQSHGAGIVTTPNFVKVIRGADAYVALDSSGHIFNGDGSAWDDVSSGSNGLTTPRDFIAEGGQDGVFLAAYSGGIAKTQDNGVTWRKLALRASGVLTIGAAITVGDTMTIGTKVYTFVASGGSPTNGQIAIDGDIIAAINGTDGHNTANTKVTAEDGITIRSIVPGTAGNSIATTSTFTSPANKFDATTLGAKVVRAGLAIIEEPSIGETFTIESKTFTFKALAAVNGDVELGGLETTQINVVKAVNGTDGINTPHALVTADDFVANMSVMASKTVRDYGYTLATSETMANPENEWVAGTVGADELANGLRLQAADVPMTAPVADLYAVTPVEA